MVEIELERDFLVKEIPFDLSKQEYKEIVDIYFPQSFEHPCIRLRKNGKKYEITKKQPVGNDTTVQEEQTIKITEEEYGELSRLPGKKVTKKRYFIEYNGRVCELEVFQEGLKGLVLASFEFNTEEEKNSFEKPGFCITEVSHDKLFAGGMLCGKSYADIEKGLEKYEYKKQP